jgi:hypothetical protein
MNLSKNIIQVLLFSSMLMIIPMFFFPARFGLDPGMGSFTYSIIEIIYYLAIFYLFYPGAGLLHLFQGVGLTFLYRIIMGTIFGIALWVIYSTEFSVSLTLGVSRYFPAIILHVLVAPFVMKPFFLAIAGQSRSRRQPEKGAYKKPEVGRDKTGRVKPHPRKKKPSTSAGVQEAEYDSSAGIQIGQDLNGFERAVRYLGEYHAVLLAVVVDSEGLSTAVFRRGEIDPDRWTPLTLLFQESARKLLERNAEGSQLEYLDFAFDSRKLAIAKAGGFSLLVLSAHEEDDLLGIRITQAVDIVRKYSSERYGHLLSAVTEEQYVSST